MLEKRHYRLFIEDTIDAINKIEGYIEGMDYEAFTKNNMATDAVVRNLEIIGEAAKNIPDDIRDKYPNIPWKRMVGLRNIVIHEYFGIDLENIWKIITQNLPEVKPDFMKISELMQDKEKNGR